MKATYITLLAIITVIIAACSSSKKAATSTVAPVPSTTTSILLLKPADGVYAPGNEELTAIQAQYKDVTLEKLKEGHTLYTAGACVNCHGAMDIYQREETRWKDIIDDMALRAQISETQKDAVYKYVLAIKAAKK